MEDQEFIKDEPSEIGGDSYIAPQSNNEDSSSGAQESNRDEEQLSESVKKRIGMQSKKLSSLERRLEETLRENERLKNQYSGQNNAPQTYQSNNHEDEDDETTKFINNYALVKQAEEIQNKENNFREVIDRIKQKEDYFEIEEASRNVPISQGFKNALVEIASLVDNPDEVIHQALKDPKELQKLSSMSENQIISRLSILSARLDHGKKIHGSSVPPPIKPVKSSGGAAPESSGFDAKSRRDELRKKMSRRR